MKKLRDGEGYDLAKSSREADPRPPGCSPTTGLTTHILQTGIRALFIQTSAYWNHQLSPGPRTKIAHENILSSPLETWMLRMVLGWPQPPGERQRLIGIRISHPLRSLVLLGLLPLLPE